MKPSLVDLLEPRLTPLDLAHRLTLAREVIPGRLVFTTSFGIEDQWITHTILTLGLDIEVATLDTKASPGSDDPASRIREIDLRNALRQLSEQDRSIVAMRYLAEMSSEDIGTAVGLSAAGVRTRLARARDRLRGELAR